MTTPIHAAPASLGPTPSSGRPESELEGAASAFLSSLFGAFTIVDASRAQHGAFAQAVAPPAMRERRQPLREETHSNTAREPRPDERSLTSGSAQTNPLRADDAPGPSQPASSPRGTRRQASSPISTSSAPGTSGPVTAHSGASLPLAADSDLTSALPGAGVARPTDLAASDPLSPVPATTPGQPGAALTGPLARLAAAALPSGPAAAAAGQGASSGPLQTSGARTLLAATAAAPRAPSSSPSPAPSPPRTTSRAAEAVEVQMARALATALRAGQGGASITLRPESLGTVHVRLDVRAAVVRARIEASTEEAARMLRDAAPALQQALSAKGLEVAGVEVITTSGSDAPGPDGQSRPRHEAAPDRGHANLASDHAQIEMAGDPESVRHSMPLTVDASGVIRVDALV